LELLYSSLEEQEALRESSHALDLAIHEALFSEEQIEKRKYYEELMKVKSNNLTNDFLIDYGSQTNTIELLKEYLQNSGKKYLLFRGI
jgi:regulator of protease activity HflC (stomatin/prohibitin superfamily)